MTSVSSRGNYSILASSESVSGSLESSDGEHFFQIESGTCTIAKALFVPFQTPLPTSLPFDHTNILDPSFRSELTPVYQNSVLTEATFPFDRSSLHRETNVHEPSLSCVKTQTVVFSVSFE
jgi:hypothetical protein